MLPKLAKLVELTLERKKKIIGKTNKKFQKKKHWKGHGKNLWLTTFCVIKEVDCNTSLPVLSTASNNFPARLKLKQRVTKNFSLR
jgi:hypothetical protein